MMGYEWLKREQRENQNRGEFREIVFYDISKISHIQILVMIFFLLYFPNFQQNKGLDLFKIVCESGTKRMI